MQCGVSLSSVSASKKINSIFAHYPNSLQTQKWWCKLCKLIIFWKNIQYVSQNRPYMFGPSFKPLTSAIFTPKQKMPIVYSSEIEDDEGKERERWYFQFITLYILLVRKRYLIINSRRTTWPSPRPSKSAKWIFTFDFFEFSLWWPWHSTMPYDTVREMM